MYASIDFSINGLRAENRSLSQWTPTKALPQPGDPNNVNTLNFD